MIEDVPRFVELTGEARRELAAAPRLPLSDPAAAASTSAAINRFITRKELARKPFPRAALIAARAQGLR